MKQLFVIRHAKSSWKNISLADYERPLNKRGMRNIPEMADFLTSRYDKIDTFVSSHAVRAHETAKGIATGFGYPTDNIHIDESLYHAGPIQIMGVVKSLSDKHHSAAIFGHNPGFTDFVNALTGSMIDNVPTCGVAVIDLPIKKWSKAAFGNGDLALFTYPKAL